MQLSWDELKTKLGELRIIEPTIDLDKATGIVVTWWNMVNDEERVQFKMKESLEVREHLKAANNAEPDSRVIRPFPMLSS